MANSETQMHEQGDGSQSPRLVDRLTSEANLWVILVSLVMVAYVLLHCMADSKLPLPWVDESHFLWQAVAFSEHGNLHAPELNVERTIHWMPPGYFVVVGSVFEFTGVSLGVARGVSLLAMMMAAVVVFTMVRRFGVRLLGLIIGAGFFLSVPSIKAGNVARMDSLLWLMVVSGFGLILKQRQMLGLSLMALSVLVHPNGVYFLGFALALCLFENIRDGKWRRLDAFDITVIGITSVAWVGYLVYVSGHWSDFQSDMAFQLARKSSYDLSRLITFNNIGELIVATAAGVYCWRKSLPVGKLFFLAIPAWLVYVIGIEMWYKFMYGMGYFLLAVICLVVLEHYFTEKSIRIFQRLRPVALAVSAVLVLFGALYWHQRQIPGMEYMTMDDLADVGGQLDSLAVSHPGSVIEFFPTPDAFYFMEQRERGLQFSNPKFSTRRPDYFLVRESAIFAAHFNPESQGVSEIQGWGTGEIAKHLIRSRGGSEKWYLIPVGND